MKKFAILGIVVGLAAATSDALACTCAPPPPVKQALKDAQAVFAGKVVDVQSTSGKNPFGTVEITFEVLEHWKGEPNRKVKVHTSRSSASCGFPFFKGEDYLVYGFLFQNRELSTNLCTRTKPLDQAYEELQELGPGTRP